MGNIIEFTKFKEIFETEPIVALDTNVLLDLFRFSVNASKNIIEVLTKVEDNIWIPNHVKKEFDKNKDDVKRKQFNKYKNIPKEIKEVINKAKIEINRKFYRYKHFEFPNINELEEYFNNAHNEQINKLSSFVDSINDEEQGNRDLFISNEIENFISRIVSLGNIGEEYNFVKLINIYQEGEVRYKYHIPPGFKDEETKNGLDKFGDLIIWKQILEHSKATDKHIIFVTDDEKIDWWEVANVNGSNTAISPRKELIEEFKAINGEAKNYYMITLKEIYSHLSKLLNIISINTSLELESKDYIDMSLSDSLYEKIENDITEIMNAKDTYEISEEIGRKFDELEVIEVAEPVITDIYLDYLHDRVEYNCEFKVQIECNAIQNNSYSTDKVGIISFNLDGSFSISRYIDYDCKDFDETNTEYTDFNLLNVNIGGYNFTDIDEVCVVCGKNIGDYNFSDDGLICERCSRNSRFEVCPECGSVVPIERMSGDGICIRCFRE